MESSREFITLGADVGGRDAFMGTNRHVLALRCLLSKELSNISEGSSVEIALVLRIDGSVQAWEKSGVENIAFDKRSGFITADIFVPVEAWFSKDVSSIRRFLVGQVTHAINLVAENMNNQGFTFDRDALSEPLERVRQQYLG